MIYEATIFHTKFPGDHTFAGPHHVGLSQDIIADSPEEVAQMMFGLFNRDDRANRYCECSLSVGDIVRVREYRDGRPNRDLVHPFVSIVYLGCASVGWTEVKREAIRPDDRKAEWQLELDNSATLR